MKKTIEALVLCAVMMSTVACGGVVGEEEKDEEPIVLLESSMTVREYYERIDEMIVSSLCHRAFVCPEKDPFYSWVFSVAGNEDTCTEVFSGSEIEDHHILTLELAVREGRLAFDGSRAESCLQHYERELRAAQCSFNFELAIDSIQDSGSCQNVLKGKQLTGDLCADGDECSEGYCESTSTNSCGGICQRYAQKGEGCGNGSAVCGGGLSCLVESSDGTGQCIGLGSRKNGEVCSVDSHCSRSSVCLEGTCQTAKDQSPTQPGELCWLDYRDACAPGYVCSDEGDDSELGTCVAPQPQGSPCNYRVECALGLTCRANNGGASCQPKSRLGQACDVDWDCEEGVCGNGMCKKYGACDPT